MLKDVTRYSIVNITSTWYAERLKYRRSATLSLNYFVFLAPNRIPRLFGGAAQGAG